MAAASPARFSITTTPICSRTGTDAASIQDLPFLPNGTAHRLTRAYGSRARSFPSGQNDLGRPLAADLGTREPGYLVDTEFARDACDVLSRRTKLGLTATDTERAAIDRFIKERRRGG